MRVLEAVRRQTVGAAISSSSFVLLLVLALLFEDLSTAGRALIATAAIAGWLALFLVGHRSLFHFRLSVSTAVLLLAVIGAVAGTANPVGRLLAPDTAAFLFFGVVPVAAAMAFFVALIQFVRFRSVQFVLEATGAFALVRFAFWAGAQI